MCMYRYMWYMYHVVLGMCVCTRVYIREVFTVEKLCLLYKLQVEWHQYALYFVVF